MINDEETVAKLLPEPPDGSVLVVQGGPEEYKVVWRDDDAACDWGGHPDDRWFDDGDTDPMALYQHAKYAERVWLLPSHPVAQFVKRNP